MLAGLTLGTEALAEIPEVLAAAQARYQSQVDDMNSRRAAGLEKLNRAYAEQLQTLSVNARNSGDLDAVLLLRNETDRFQLMQAVGRSDLVSAPQTLRDLQTRYMQSAGRHNADIDGQIAGLTERYLAALERYQQQSVQDNRLSDALHARREIENVRADMRYLLETAPLVEEMPEPAAVAQPAEPVAAPPVQEPAAASFPAHWPPPAAPPPVRIFRLGDEPQVENLSEQRMVFTSMRSRAAAMRISAKIYLYMDIMDERGTRWRGHYSASRSTSGTYTYYPRLEFTAAGDERPDGWTAVFEYFIRPLDGRTRYTKARCEHVKLSGMQPGETWVVDGAGIQMRQYEHRHQSFYSGTQRYQHGHEYYGVIVSIYDADGQIVFQRTDQHRLTDQASDSIPARMNDHAGVPHRI